MRGMRFIVLGLGLVLFAGTGCASSSHGNAIQSDKVAQIQKGKTTRAEVEAMFGQPINTGLMGDGRRTMFYTFTETKSRVKGQSFIPVAGVFMGGAKADTHQQTLQVILNKDNVVEDYEFNDSNTKTDVRHGPFNSSMKTTPAN